jgi:hypothetical protein
MRAQSRINGQGQAGSCTRGRLQQVSQVCERNFSPTDCRCRSSDIVCPDSYRSLESGLFKSAGTIGYGAYLYSHQSFRTSDPKGAVLRQALWTRQVLRQPLQVPQTENHSERPGRCRQALQFLAYHRDNCVPRTLVLSAVLLVFGTLTGAPDQIGAASGFAFATFQTYIHSCE